MDLVNVLWNSANTFVAGMAVYFTWKHRRKDDSEQAKRAAGAIVNALTAVTAVLMARYPRMNPITSKAVVAVSDALDEARYHKGLRKFVAQVQFIMEKANYEIEANTKMFGAMVRPRDNAIQIAEQVSELTKELEQFIAK